VHLRGGEQGSPAPLEMQSRLNREQTPPAQVLRESRHRRCSFPEREQTPSVHGSRERADDGVEAYANRRSSPGTSNRLG